jgi:hypothetical protein
MKKNRKNNLRATLIVLGADSIARGLDFLVEFAGARAQGCPRLQRHISNTLATH